MSTALGIASVTHVLKDLLNNGLIDNDVSNLVGSTVEVSSRPPGLIDNGSGNTGTQLNIFLYRVSPNTGWNNVGYPSRDARGEIVGNPPLALNLHYLLTAFADQELHAEVLLGYGMQLLHETPALGRTAIRQSLTLATPENPSTLPAELRQLSTSELAEQVEMIKITPETINTEEISRLWTAFQTRYRPCAGYMASVVLIESKRPTRTPLPVRQRAFYTLPFKQPVLEQIWSQAGPLQPILPNQRILAGHTIYLRGFSLKSESLTVRINGEPFTPNAQDIGDTEIALTLPATLRAGIQGVQVVHSVEMGQPPTPRQVVESNLLSFVLSPDITGVAVANAIPAGNNRFSADVGVTLTPLVHPRQRAVLLLNQTGLPPGSSPVSYSFVLPADFWDAHPNPVNVLTFPVQGVLQGTYLVRVQIDGAESPLQTDINGVYNAPQTTIP